ncbi:MAG TPA: hypothetical protein VMB78_07600 [Dissulfurispiraceae bacterium]|nr:hypothetical protein [Dissulfurispiraceae bacterium]
MAIYKKQLSLGFVMAACFFVILFLTFSPIFPKSLEGKAQNGLEWADETFNRLSKGSSYFIPKVAKDAEKYNGKTFSVTIKMNKDGDKPGDAEKRVINASKVFIAAGAVTEAQGDSLKIDGDLGKVLAAALQDADAMFKNDGNAIKTKYGTDDEKKMFRQWYNSFVLIDKAFKKTGKIEEANMISSVTKKAIEAAYNYYGVDAAQVKDHVGLMTFLLVFYVAYTMWWGFAIYNMFNGLGLSMTKAKVKKEV